MKNSVLFLLIIAGLSVLTWYFVPVSHATITGILGGFIISGVTLLYKHRDNLPIFYECVRYFNSDVRISFSYLFRIKLDGRYLLIWNANRRVYQPVGGAYQFYSEALPFLKSELKCRDDIYQNEHGYNPSDVRLLIKGRRLPTFMRWFYDGKDREWDVWREFYEELVESNILTVPPFGFVRTKFVRRCLPPLEFAFPGSPPNRRLADIYEVVLDDSQSSVLKALHSCVGPNPEGSIPICWASEEEIRRKGVPDGGPRTITISDNAQLLLDEN